MTITSPPTDTGRRAGPLKPPELFERLAGWANSGLDDTEKPGFAGFVVTLAPHLDAEAALTAWERLCDSLRGEAVARYMEQGCQQLSYRRIVNRAALTLAGGPYEGLRYRGNTRTVLDLLDRGDAPGVADDPWGWTAVPYNAHLADPR